MNTNNFAQGTFDTLQPVFFVLRHTKIRVCTFLSISENILIEYLVIKNMRLYNCGADSEIPYKERTLHKENNKYNRIK